MPTQGSAEHDQRDGPHLDRLRRDPDVAIAQLVEAAVRTHGRNDSSRRDAPDDDRRKCRGERQRRDAGNDHRDRDGHGKLLVELACHSAQERDRQEDGHQHQHDRDQRAGDLRHRELGGLPAATGCSPPCSPRRFSTTTIASSTTRPIARDQAEHGQHVDRETPADACRRNVPMIEIGNRENRGSAWRATIAGKRTRQARRALPLRRTCRRPSRSKLSVKRLVSSAIL